MTNPWAEVADRVFVRRYDFFDQNVGVVIGQAGVLVIDTRTTHEQADEIRDDLAGLTAAPVVAVLNTHHHYDHTFGNARFLPVPIWGHDRCAGVLRTDGEAMRRRVMEQLPELAGELAAVDIVPPDRTFTDEATLDLGDRSVAFRYLGRGHTDNDVVALVPDAGVLFAGDLLENDAPPSYGDAFPLAWAETVEARLLPLIRGAVVPGHGSVGDAAVARRQAGELRAMADLGRQVVSGEIGETDALARAPFPAATARVAVARSRIEESG